MSVRTLHIYMIGALILTLFLLLSLVIFDCFPLLPGNDNVVIIQQANLQLARDEFISKDVLTLAYRPATYHSQAVSELQTILPQFQQVQAGLLSGNAALGLPGNPPDNVRVALLATQSDYTAITTATSHLLAHPDSASPDPIQVEIILQHERLYIGEMYQVITLLQQNAEAHTVQLALIEVVVIACTGAVVLLKYLLFARYALKRIIDRTPLQGRERSNYSDHA